MDLRQMFQEVLDMPHKERVDLAKQAFSAFAKEFSDKETFTAFLGILVAISAAVDGKVSEEEYQLFIDISGLSFSRNEFFDLVSNNASTEAYELVDEVVDNMSNDGKKGALLFALAFMTSDGELTVNEQKLFAILLN